MVYFGTKELYELSSYKGIKYFRESFLFFAIAYFCGSFIKLSFAFIDIRKLFISPIIFQIISVFLFIYFSSMAIFYLIYSVMWKKWENKNNIFIFHILALAIAIIGAIFQNTIIYLAINLFILISIIITTFILYNSKRKTKFNLYGIYILLILFWILNIWDILIPNFIKSFQITIYLASIGIFMIILYKVLKKSGSN